MTTGELQHAFVELELVGRRRALLLWTVTATLALVILLAMTLAFVVSLIMGARMDATQIVYGGGIGGVSGGWGAILRRLLSGKTP